MTENIIQCSTCKAPMIQEVEIHKCFKELNNALFDTDGTFSFDGKKWYKWFPEWSKKDPPTQNQQHFKHQDDSTEPKFLIILFHIEGDQVPNTDSSSSVVINACY